MTILGCNVWEDDHRLADLADLEATVSSLDDLRAEVSICDDADSLVDPFWRMLWTLRRMMWRDLIPEQRVGVRFVHRHDVGEGEGPFTCIGMPSSIEGPSAEWVNDPTTTTFACEVFAESDIMHLAYDDHGELFGWPELSLSYESYKDRDDPGGFDRYEFSFDAEAVVQVDTSLAPPVWSRLPPSMQVAVLEAIIKAHTAEMDHFQELLVDGSDVLAMIAAHPASSAEVLEAGRILGGLPFELGLGYR